MGPLGMFPRCPILPTVHWDGMDSGDRGSVDGTCWDVPTLSIPHGIIQVGNPTSHWTSVGNAGQHSYLCTHTVMPPNGITIAMLSASAHTEPRARNFPFRALG